MILVHAFYLAGGEGRRMKLLAVAAIACVAAVACAKKPESIGPAYVSQVPYQEWSCGQLAQEVARVDAALTVASGQQKKARTNDIAGVILIGLPVSSLSGDNIAPQIANLKGQKQAIEQVMIGKNCVGSPAPPPPAG
jgi:hypothetical protein